MLLDATPLDLIALVGFLVVWAGYGGISARLPGLNNRLARLRHAWMQRMVERDNRIMDSQLIGHTIHSVTFFASTTMLVLAALIGAFGAVDRVYEVITELSFTVRTSKDFFEVKMVLLIAMFVYGFFKFTWALRQYNYLCALIGSVPLAPVSPDRLEEAARACADLMTEAVSSFNAGLRSYYFALAVLGWFVHPGLFLGFTAGMVGVLLNRQLRSPTAVAVDGHLRQVAARGGRSREEG